MWSFEANFCDYMLSAARLSLLKSVFWSLILLLKSIMFEVLLILIHKLTMTCVDEKVKHKYCLAFLALNHGCWLIKGIVYRFYIFLYLVS